MSAHEVVERAAVAAVQTAVQLRARARDVQSAMKVLNDAADGRDFTPEEQARWNAAKREQELLASQLDDVLTAVDLRPGAVVTSHPSSDADPKRGFTSLGEFAQAVAADSTARKYSGRPRDPRILALQHTAAAPNTAANESSGVDGGSLVPPEFGAEVWRLAAFDEESLLPLCAEINVTTNALTLPKDETPPWSTSGPQAYWTAELGQITPSKPRFGGTELRLKKLAALIPMTDELMADAPALTDYLPRRLAVGITWKTNEALLFGNGAGVPLGALSGGGVVTVPKDSGQFTGTLSATNIVNMFARLPPGSHRRAVWLINNDVLPALFTLTLGNYPIYLPTGQAKGAMHDAPLGTLLGRPVIVSQHANTFSSQGDIVLVDLAYYQAITKAEGITTATSMHLYFDADSVAFRVTFRLDGAPLLTAPVAPARGSTTLSPYVQLGAR